MVTGCAVPLCLSISVVKTTHVDRRCWLLSTVAQLSVLGAWMSGCLLAGPHSVVVSWYEMMTYSATSVQYHPCLPFAHSSPLTVNDGDISVVRGVARNLLRGAKEGVWGTEPGGVWGRRRRRHLVNI